MGTRGDIVRAVHAGEDAARAGQDVTACPYPPRTVLATAWLRGYGKGRDHGPDPAE
jgi:hypothetical protein